MEKIEKKTWEKIEKKTWEEFRATGLLWFINMTLNIFGWAIVCEEYPDDTPGKAYPMRTRDRGFTAEANDEGYKKVTRWMAQWGHGLLCDFYVDEVDAAHKAWAADDEREAVKVARTREANSREIAGMFLRGNQEAQNE